MSRLGHIPLAPGFNPQALPPLAEPVAGVRSWQWLADQATDPEEKKAYLAEHVTGCGVVDPRQRDVLRRALPVADVIASHITQDVLFTFDGAPNVRACLRPGTGGVFPFAVPVAIIGTVPPAASAQLAVGRNLPRELQWALRDQQIDSLSAVAADRDRRWLEDALIVDYRDDAAVVSEAVVHLQPYLTVWRQVAGQPRLEVLDLSDPAQAQVVASAPARLYRVDVRTCPMQPGAGPGDICKAHGGPWTSGAISAFARWERKRARVIPQLGCDACGDGAIKVFLGQVFPGRRNTHDVLPDAAPQSRHDELVAAPEQ